MGAWVRVMPTMPLNEMSLKLTLCSFNSGAMRRANQTMPVTQIDVTTDSMTLRAVAVEDRLYVGVHHTELRIQTVTFKASLKGRTWKTMTQIIFDPESVGGRGKDYSDGRHTLNQRKLPLSCLGLGLFLRTP